MNLVAHETEIRLGAFVGVFAIMAWLETRAPRRALTVDKAARWTHNLALTALNTALVRLVLPVGATGLALVAAERGWGLLNQLAWPPVLRIFLGMVVLDLAIYFQHVLFHATPTLWRLHRVHHADLDFDVTTGARFHPIEILLSMLIKFAVVLVIGPPAVAVLCFEVVLNGAAMFNHANLRLPSALDRVLRWGIVTPDMHRVHHSVVPNETNSNFGFNLSCWDRLFGTYRAAPAAGHVGMTIGLSGLRNPAIADRLPEMLALPFRALRDDYAINRRGAAPARDPSSGDPISPSPARGSATPGDSAEASHR